MMISFIRYKSNIFELFVLSNFNNLKLYKTVKYSIYNYIKWKKKFTLEVLKRIVFWQLNNQAIVSALHIIKVKRSYYKAIITAY